MRKVINGKTYNTDTAEVLGRKTVGSYGSPEGYEEIRYLCKHGEFVYGVGGQSSPYPKPAIVPDSAARGAGR